jgi:hypothetical protein
MSAAGTQHDFAEIQRSLEEILSQLKTTWEPNFRKKLLREMRRLLVEADRFLDFLE